MPLCNTELGTIQNAWLSQVNWCFEWTHVQANRVCYITPDIFLDSTEDKLIIFSYALAFYRHRGPRILMAELNKGNINTKQHSCNQDILFLHPEFFFCFKCSMPIFKFPKHSSQPCKTTQQWHKIQRWAYLWNFNLIEN